MYSQLGLEEIGIDGGGVLQEFCDAVIMATFDSNRGLFKFVAQRSYCSYCGEAKLL